MSTNEKAKEQRRKKTEAELKKAQKVEVIQPLRVEIEFPSIVDLKQALAFDSDGNLIVAIAFKARVDQYEIFRLVNLLKQPHGTLFAIIGSPQSAMDFIFNKEQDRMDILKAASAIVAAKTDVKGNILPAQEVPDSAVKIQSVAFNHIPEEKDPFGVYIEFIDGTGEIKSAAGRGKTATEAIIAGVHNCGAVAADLKEPFEIRAALELLEPSADCYKLIRVIDVGSFDIGEGEGESSKKNK